MRSKESKCSRVRYLGRNNFMFQYKLGADLQERSYAERGLIILVDSSLSMSQQFAPVAKKASVYPGVQ